MRSQDGELEERLVMSNEAAGPFLTMRERQVLLLTAEGLTSKEIAGRLGISPRTADVHRAHVIQKLGLRNRVEAIRYVMDHPMKAEPE